MFNLTSSAARQIQRASIFNNGSDSKRGTR